MALSCRAVFSPPVEIVAEIIRIPTPISLLVFTQKEGPDILAIIYKGLNNERQLQVGDGSLVENIFDRRPKIYAHTSISSILLGNHLFMTNTFIFTNGDH